MAAVVIAPLLMLLILYGIPFIEAERAYPEGCSKSDFSYYDYDSIFYDSFCPVKSVDDFLLTRRLGTGKFSDVFEAVCCDDKSSSDNRIAATKEEESSLCVIKCLKPVSERKIRRELLVLHRCRFLPNLARLRAVVLRPEMTCLVLQHAGRDAQWLCHPCSGSGGGGGGREDKQSTPSYLSEYEIRYYLCHLLVALDGLHAAGIMHRDVKPRNVLINRHRSSSSSSNRGKVTPTGGGRSPPPLMLVDLGLADFYVPGVPYNVRVASRHYKAPELLTGLELYDYAVDLWGVGCILAGLLLRREPFFRGRDNVDQLGRIAEVLGVEELCQFLHKYRIQVSPEIEQEIARHGPAAPLPQHGEGAKGRWRRAVLDCRGDGCPLPPGDGLDLLERLLVYDPDRRWTAAQALRHPFFDAVRERVRAELAAPPSFPVWEARKD